MASTLQQPLEASVFADDSASVMTSPSRRSRKKEKLPKYEYYIDQYGFRKKRKIKRAKKKKLTPFQRIKRKVEHAPQYWGHEPDPMTSSDSSDDEEDTATVATSLFGSSPATSRAGSPASGVRGGPLMMTSSRGADDGLDLGAAASAGLPSTQGQGPGPGLGSLSTGQLSSVDESGYSLARGSGFRAVRGRSPLAETGAAARRKKKLGPSQVVDAETGEVITLNTHASGRSAADDAWSEAYSDWDATLEMTSMMLEDLNESLRVTPSSPSNDPGASTQDGDGDGATAVDGGGGDGGDGATAEDEAPITRMACKALFDSLDEDGGGRLEEAEFLFAMKSLGLKMGKQRALAMFAAADVDGGGAIDFEEFYEVISDASLSEEWAALIKARVSVHMPPYMKFEMQGKMVPMLNEIRRGHNEQLIKLIHKERVAERKRQRWVNATKGHPEEMERVERLARRERAHARRRIRRIVCDNQMDLAAKMIKHGLIR